MSPLAHLIPKHNRLLNTGAPKTNWTLKRRPPDRTEKKVCRQHPIPIQLSQRPTRMSHKSRKYHDRVARQYDSIYDDAYWEYHDELTWRAIKPHLPRDLSSVCLDLGCGTGKWGLRLLKSGFATWFVDHSAAMVEQARRKVEAQGPRAKRATLLAADMIDLSAIESETFTLTLAMGDPLSICSDAQRAAREMHRITRPGGIVIATADNKLAALDHFAQSGDIDALEAFVHTGQTTWLTADKREQFELQTFTPASLRKLFEKSGFEVLDLIGKPLLPIRKNPALLADPTTMERLLRLELQLSKDPTTPATAGHLQLTARRPSE